MKRVILGGLAALLLASGVWADVITFKDGSVLECKIVDETQQTRRGRTTYYYVVEDENGKRTRIDKSKVAAVYKGKPSWEVRREALEWYEKRSARVKETWSSHAMIGRECKRKKVLNDKMAFHFRRAYEIRKETIKDDMRSREKFAKWLERSLGLFSEARDEWRTVFEYKKEKAGQSADDHYDLAKWCEKHSLYDEALEEYERVLIINPANTRVVKALEKINNLRTTRVNSDFFRQIRDQFKTAAEYVGKVQNKDGSYGADVREAGVQAHRAMSCLCGETMLSQWEFNGIDDPAILKKPPEELEKVIEFLMKASESTKKLRGPDVWGNIWTMQFLTRILRHDRLKRFRDACKAKIKRCIDAMAKMQGPDGGWMYYTFSFKTSATFVTAPMLMNMLDAKEEGVAVPNDMIQKSVAHLKRCKQADSIYMYRTTVRQTVQGSVARSPLCEMALIKAGEGSMSALSLAVDNFFKHRHILEKIKGKRGTHMGTGGTAPYYFMYGHYWTTRAIKMMDKGTMNQHLAKMRDLTLGFQEDDGTFWDWPLTRPHKTYGTALGAMIFYEIATLPRQVTANKKKKR
jgi:tetratricopeptide (TPR) repeat protein